MGYGAMAVRIIRRRRRFSRARNFKKALLVRDHVGFELVTLSYDCYIPIELKSRRYNKNIRYIGLELSYMN